MKSNNGFRLVCAAAVLCAFSFAASSLHAQLADTIWEGVQVVSGINLQGMRDRMLMDYPSLKGGRSSLPLEIWFWDNTRFGIVFRNDRYDPARNSRKGEYLGWDYNNSKPDYSRSFTYTLKAGNGTFLGRDLRLVDSVWQGI